MDMIFTLLTSFAVGFVGSLHCLGMCGPLVLAYSLRLRNQGGQAVPSWSSSLGVGLRHHLSFHFGRLFTYGLLGALAAGLFRIADLSLFFLNLRGGMTLLAGALMAFFGLLLLKIVPMPGLFLLPYGKAEALWNRLSPALSASSRWSSRLGLGVAAGFLPCGLSWAMIVKAANSRDALEGFFTMVAFGLGTVPALCTVGLSSTFVSMKVRLLGERVAAASLIAMGMMMIVKGGRIFV